MLQRRHLPQPIQIGKLACENVIGRDRFQGFGREGQVHVMTRFALKIDNEAAKNGIHSCDSANAPTAVNTIAALGQLQERLQMVPSNLAGSYKLLKLFSHNSASNVISR